ncbi:MAG TPA: TetR/AcrR family transcriptional regulator [Solirubrobacterales bacterium]|nr:TetR/AcrR family transcriptional regulator [Solirubrobacterales bacterium]
MHQSTPAPAGQGNQRERIVDAMIESCAAKTYAATTITDIVAGARISRTTFYKQFDDKRECFDAAVAHCLDLLREAGGTAHTPDEPPGDAVRKACAAVLEAMADRPGLAQLMAVDAIAVDPAAVERYRAATIPALEALWADDGVAPVRHLDPRLAFGQAQVLILNELATGRPDRLPELLPELVYLAVSPFGGHGEAIKQAGLARQGVPSGAPSR